MRSKDDLPLPVWACKSWIKVSSCHNLTTDVEKVGEEEGLLVELLNGQDYRPIQAAPQSLLWATLVCYEGLQHGPHHVKLRKKVNALLPLSVRHHQAQPWCSAMKNNTSPRWLLLFAPTSHHHSELEIITSLKKEALGTTQLSTEATFNTAWSLCGRHHGNSC